MFLQIVFVILLLNWQGVTAEVSETCSPTRYIHHNGVLVINSTVGSEVLNVTGVASVQECVMRCRMKGCAAAVFWKSSGLCQLVTVSQDPGSAGSSERRLMGAEADAKVMKLENFEDLMKPSAGINFTRIFTHTGTGRTGSIQQRVINVTGCYRIEIAGAKGGDNTYVSPHKLGGRGALAAGNVSLTAGTELSIVVGQAGGPAQSGNYGSAGGGGGSFVYQTSDNHLLMAAGGGGGASYGNDGRPGEAGTSGTDSIGTNIPSRTGTGGSGGQPGSNDQSSADPDRNPGGCGAGWLGKPAVARQSSKFGDRGGSRTDGWVGGSAGTGSPADGGFGGGGGGGAVPIKGAAGAGGGFSGGGAGAKSDHAGGGGGSFCGGSGCVATTGGNSGSEHGFVVLHPLADGCNYD